MSPFLICHVSAGILGILSGAAALSVRKGEGLHRAFGTVSVLSMLTVSALAVYLAVFVPPIFSGAAPPSASVSVAVLTIYLAATAWMTVRRKDGSVGLFEKGAFLVSFGVAAALLIFGLHAASIPTAKPGEYVPYFVFASFAAFAAALDLKLMHFWPPTYRAASLAHVLRAVLRYSILLPRTATGIAEVHAWIANSCSAGACAFSIDDLLAIPHSLLKAVQEWSDVTVRRTQCVRVSLHTVFNDDGYASAVSTEERWSMRGHLKDLVHDPGGIGGPSQIGPSVS
jgi:uncharacterized membrane protein